MEKGCIVNCHCKPPLQSCRFTLNRYVLSPIATENALVLCECWASERAGEQCAAPVPDKCKHTAQVCHNRLAHFCLNDLCSSDGASIPTSNTHFSEFTRVCRSNRHLDLFSRFCTAHLRGLYISKAKGLSRVLINTENYPNLSKSN